MAYVKGTWIDDDGSNTVGTTVTAARMNNIEQGVADAQAQAATALAPRTIEGFSARVVNGANPVAGPYDWSGLGMTIERLDTGGTHDPAGSFPHRWTVHRTGWFHVGVYGSWEINPSGQRSVRIMNITTGQALAASEVVATPNRYTIHSESRILLLTVGHVVEFQCAQLNSNAIVAHKYDSNTDGSGMDLIFLGV